MKQEQPANGDRRNFIATTGSLAALAMLPVASRAAAPEGTPPTARVEPVAETFFGQSVTDPYRWMENDKDPDWEPYVKGQADHAHKVFDAIPGRAALATRIGELSGGLELVNNIQTGGPFVFLEKRPVGASSFRLYARRGDDGPERLLLNPEDRNRGDVSYAMNYWVASPDGRRVLVGLSASGSEQAVMEIIDTATGRTLPDRIDRAQYASASWLDDGSGFFFNRLSASGTKGGEDFYKDSVCWLHRVGTDADRDVKVLMRGQFDDVPIRDIDFPAVVVQPGCGFVVGLLVGGVQRELTLFTNTVAAARRGAGGWKPVCTTADQVTNFAMRGEDLYLLTEKDAPRGRVVVVKGATPAFAAAHPVVPQGKALKRGLFAARDAIYLQELDGGVGRLSKFDDRTPATPVALPFDGAVRTVRLPEALVKSKAGALFVQFRIAHPTSPAMLGGSGDTRELGLALISLELKQ